ncbi:MAG: V-type ATP synthase subunit I, partial [Spirochaetes bacterium]|nr:V-type ATP synthase subunit I [Spirochaetota bacterium]
SVLALDSRRQQVVSQMQDAGVFHLEVEQKESDDLSELREQRAYVERATMVLPRQRPEGVDAEAEAEQYGFEGALSTAKYLNEIAERRRELEDRLDQLLREELRLLPWGDFAPEDLEELRRWDVDIRLYTVTQKQFKNVSAPRLFVVNRSNGQVYFAVAYREGEERLELTPVSLPERRLADIRSDIEEKRGALEEIRDRIAERFPERENLQRALTAIDDRIRFEEVKVGMNTDESLAYITGFVPQEFEELVRDSARSGGWGLLIRDPEPDEQVPTRVKNRKSVGIIEPVFDLMDTIPGYREVDISFWFLIFFTVFFAMIIGDGGYGLLITAASIFAVIRGKRREGSPSKGAVLLTVMGIATIGWGAVTGTWFGYEPFAQIPLLASLKIEAISSFNPQSPETIQWVCFILATTHLSIAHLWKFIVGLRRGRPKIKALADLGWLLMMPGLYYLVLTVVLGQPLQDFSVYVILAGIAIVLMFSEQREGAGFFKGVGYGLANIFPTALDSISAFSDLISYIRLFAVGLATVEIAKSFNGMAAGMAADGAVGIVAAVLILFLGHTLNLIMGALSVVVHGVRLNMLEFSRHLGMEWSGVPYRPFRKQEQTT